MDYNYTEQQRHKIVVQSCNADWISDE